MNAIFSKLVTLKSDFHKIKTLVSAIFSKLVTLKRDFHKIKTVMSAIFSKWILFNAVFTWKNIHSHTFYNKYNKTNYSNVCSHDPIPQCLRKISLLNISHICNIHDILLLQLLPHSSKKKEKHKNIIFISQPIRIMSPYIDFIKFTFMKYYTMYIFISNPVRHFRI